MRCVVPGLLASAAWVAGCGVERDDRPLELEYLTQAVFAPSCGLTQCHSTFRQVDNLVFDTPEGVRRSLVAEEWRDGKPALQFDSSHPDPQFPYTSRLYILIATTDPFPFPDDVKPKYERIPRMPLDAPLPIKDRELLVSWIQEPVFAPDGTFLKGARALGAQCNPERNPGRFACDDDQVVLCGDDWNFGQLVVDCMGKGCKPDCDLDQCPVPDCVVGPKEDCMDPCLPLHCPPETMCN